MPYLQAECPEGGYGHEGGGGEGEGVAQGGDDHAHARTLQSLAHARLGGEGGLGLGGCMVGDENQGGVREKYTFRVGLGTFRRAEDS